MSTWSVVRNGIRARVESIFPRRAGEIKGCSPSEVCIDCFGHQRAMCVCGKHEHLGCRQSGVRAWRGGSVINVGVIGYGYWGPNLVRNLFEVPDTQVIAVSDMRQERL